MKTNKALEYLNTSINKLNGDRTEFDLTQYKATLLEIQKFEPQFKNQSDLQLQDIFQELKNSFTKKQSLSNWLPQVYALVKEICQRKLKICPYDVQLIGAIALNEGNIIEMQTGEGKTLTAVFPAILNTLVKKGVHILTFNDYLAKRDAHWMRPVYEFFRISVGFVAENMSNKEKTEAYNSDITYSTAKEVGFNYLRSCMAYSKEELIIKEFNYAIVDEADALLIDEARNPLVLAGNLLPSNIDHYKTARFVSDLAKYRDYSLDKYERNVHLTEQGIEKAENFYQINNLFEEANNSLHSSVNLALQAMVLLHKDIDYIIKEGKVKLVDELTGRIVEDRKWQNGLQTAVEAKEMLPIQSEGNILGSISIQHLMSQYPKLSGMTGTAQQASQEFANFYNMGVVVIPPNRPCQRMDFEEEIYSRKKLKIKAIIDEVNEVHNIGRPVLIGTFTIKESEELQLELMKHNLRSNVLNAKNDELEAKIISAAGKLDAITISTNMAGRGTDIILGGQDEEERKKVVALGGLHIIGTNRHESIRIDNQLRGRAGRQGDPGSTKFIISLEDDLMIKYKLKELLPKSLRNENQNLPLKNKAFSKSIAQAQRIISGQMYEIRRTLFAYTSFIEKQRKIIQFRRDEVLFNLDLINTNIKTNNKWYQQLQEYLLNQYDLNWAFHLTYISELREGIYWERVGGNDPLRIFYQKADEHFRHILSEIDNKINDLPDYKFFPESLKISRPSSTWTYIVNDNPFKNQLGVFLSGSANMGFQIDVLTAPLLFLLGIFKRFNKDKKENSE